MELHEYFKAKKGVGVLATSDDKGRVDAAIYSKPHFMEDGDIAFIMMDRLTHHNLQTNGHATYLFIEEGPGYHGKRLFLSKIREEKDSDLLYSIRRRKSSSEKEDGQSRFLVFFKIETVLPLVGDAGEE